MSFAELKMLDARCCRQVHRRDASRDPRARGPCGQHRALRFRMCYPCPRTPVIYVPGPYTREGSGVFASGIPLARQSSAVMTEKRSSSRESREVCSLRFGRCQTYVFAKKRFWGRGRLRFSLSVAPSYSRRKSPRRCSSGTTSSTKSSSPAGK